MEHLELLRLFNFIIYALFFYFSYILAQNFLIIVNVKLNEYELN